MTNKWTITLEKTAWDNPNIVAGGFHAFYDIPEEHLLKVFEEMCAIHARGAFR